MLLTFTFDEKPIEVSEKKGKESVVDVIETSQEIFKRMEARYNDWVTKTIPEQGEAERKLEYFQKRQQAILEAIVQDPEAVKDVWKFIDQQLQGAFDSNIREMYYAVIGKTPTPEKKIYKRSRPVVGSEGLDDYEARRYNARNGSRERRNRELALEIIDVMEIRRIARYASDFRAQVLQNPDIIWKGYESNEKGIKMRELTEEKFVIPAVEAVIPAETDEEIKKVIIKMVMQQVSK
jgi:hypothetical protein